MTCARTTGLFAVSLVLPLLACSGGSSTVNPGKDLAGALGDASVAGPDMAPDYYAPTGFSLVPFLSADAEHSFPAADMVLQGGRNYLAVIETDAGRMVIDLLETDTPITVNSFVFLALHHYFDGIAFHRVIPNFMAQTGDPNTLDADRGAWGRGSPGYKFVDEKKGLGFDAPGVVGMANSGANTNGSQFFIVFKPYTPPVNTFYTVFARVTEGIEVLGLIARGEPPVEPTRIVRVHIVAK